jgi:hypothetical protein
LFGFELLLDDSLIVLLVMDLFEMEGIGLRFEVAMDLL